MAYRCTGSTSALRQRCFPSCYLQTRKGNDVRTMVTRLPETSIGVKQGKLRAFLVDLGKTMAMFDSRVISQKDTIKATIFMLIHGNYAHVAVLSYFGNTRNLISFVIKWRDLRSRALCGCDW